MTPANIRLSSNRPRCQQQPDAACLKSQDLVNQPKTPFSQAFICSRLQSLPAGAAGLWPSLERPESYKRLLRQTSHWWILCSSLPPSPFCCSSKDTWAASVKSNVTPPQFRQHVSSGICLIPPAIHHTEGWFTPSATSLLQMEETQIHIS